MGQVSARILCMPGCYQQVSCWAASERAGAGPSSRFVKPGARRVSGPHSSRWIVVGLIAGLPQRSCRVGCGGVGIRGVGCGRSIIRGCERGRLWFVVLGLKVFDLVLLAIKVVELWCWSWRCLIWCVGWGEVLFLVLDVEVFDLWCSICGVGCGDGCLFPCRMQRCWNMSWWTWTWRCWKSSY